MAPVTRRSNSAGVSKPPLRKSKTREDSFSGSGVGLATSVLQNGADAALNSQPDTFIDSLAVKPPSFSAPKTNGVHVHDALQPLSTMAERVGREVEDFAEKIDRWKTKIAKAGDDASQRFKATMALVDQLETIAKDRLAGYKHDKSAPNGRSVLRSSTRSTTRNGSLAGLRPEEAEAKTRDAQMEVDTWRLFRTLLEFEFHDPAFDRRTHLRHYFDTRRHIDSRSSGGDVWERFLMENDVAREQAAVLLWLEQTARTGGHSSEEILSRLEATCGTGTSSFDRHWLYTREKLKAEKRSRLWGDSPDQDEPAVTGSEGKHLVSQLDPDAPTRQMRPLEPKDADQDRAVWEACFQMLRSGVPWNEFAEWLDDRGEGWRAASMGILCHDQTARTNVEGADYGSLWRKMCYAVAKNPAVPSHEQAVYGLLAGDLPSTLTQCKSWDDFVYVHFNALLLGHFKRWSLQLTPDTFARMDDDRFPSPPALEAVGDGDVGANIVRALQRDTTTEQEALSAEKQIQGALISRQFVPLAVAVGIAASNNLYTQRLEKSAIMPPASVQVESSFERVYENETTLRLLVHFSMIIEALRPADESVDRRYVLDRVIICYLDFLRRAGKFEALPTYAQFMEPGLADKVLGMMLADVANVDEQRTLINLMNQSGMNAVDALLEQVHYALENANIDADSESPILEYPLLAETSNLEWPGFRVNASHHPHDLSVEEEKVVRAAEWYVLVDGQLYGVLNLFAITYRSFLVNRRWSAALALTARIPYRMLLALKTPYYYGRVVDFMEDTPPVPELPPEQPRRSTRASSKQPPGTNFASLDDSWGGESRGEPDRVASFHELFKRQGQTYFELMQLTLALKALSDWRKMEDGMLSVVNDNRQPNGKPPSDARADLKSALSTVRTAVDPILHGFLTHPRTEEEDRDLSLIRQIYLPKIVIAYNSVLHFAGTLLSRENFTKSMDIARMVSSDENEELREAFTSVELMPQLVKSLTLTSKQLLRSNESSLKQGLKRSPTRKRGWDGRTVNIWDIGRGQ